MGRFTQEADIVFGQQDPEAMLKTLTTSSEGKSAGLIPQDNASINHSVLQEFSAILRRISSARSSAGVPNALLLKRALHKDQLVTTIQVKELRHLCTRSNSLQSPNNKSMKKKLAIKMLSKEK
ncbi:hypothetical protein NDU88_002596 [Pleurodeles waltl]|uniref:Uncharacterized protein n=1 Tax=Pleurodeles waltl TaxID=8319 RepID=A0AAV7LCX3_PLEWA|nr:hypothetical protein NDU88_002596 [Pleurodeles waltl]